LFLGILITKLLKLNSNKNFFIGIHEIASNIHSIQDAFTANNITCNSLIINNNYTKKVKIERNSINSSRKYLDIQSENLFSRFIKRLLLRLFLPLLFLYYLLQNDIFIFVWNKTFLPLNLDLLLLKISNKKVICYHCGDEVRYRAMQSQIDIDFKIRLWSQENYINNFLRNFYFVWLCEMTADHIISARDQATFQQIPYNNFYFPLKGTDFQNKDQQKKVTILHAPSDRKIKGTDIVLEAISNLSKISHLFDFCLLEGKKNHEILLQLTSTDIVIDQPGVWAGRFAIEGCAAGCVVVGGNNQVYMDSYDSPIIQFEPSVTKLRNTLEKLIVNRQYLNEYKELCYNFWLENYSEKSFIQYILSVLDGTAQKFSPVKNQKKLLLKGAQNYVEYIIIYLFYNPKN